ncbi:hypothetical protein DJ568_16265 [Mucilaginibacter hurinus]|uniref:Uncharacterized protein n=1 Tax=Mucilaginibacter hurinus TaxID=2201324 RepID=A0A367GKE6_9SPHI|nr:hypothetical protein [Mucilaginibacter hurinus]RCH53790.1 hypothetical protein DJ568_16265 [Mucilaginibacter hurinus]
MELNALKSAWKDVSPAAKTTEEIKEMLHENKHPVLKQIRRQFTLEITCWVVFLVFYYTALDGDRKPLHINALLVGCILFPVLHNLAGYRFSKCLINGINIRQSLQNYFSKIRVYAFVSVASRVFYASGLLVFLTYGISFNTGKYYLLAVVILAISMQIFWLGRLWMKRISKLRDATALFN